MVLGTPKAAYDAEQASLLLRPLGDDLVSEVRHDLLNQGVLAKAVRDNNRLVPGRTLKISEA
jgi:oxalate---CoA ligase